MDTTWDIDNISYNDLYKLHTGHVLFDSDSDSSASSSFWEENKPSLYTYEELKANIAVPERENPFTESVDRQKQTRVIVCYSAETNKTLELVAEKSPEIIKQEKLKHLMLPDYCYVCYTDLPHPNQASSHYQSLTHKENFDKWKEKKPQQIIEEKLKLFTCSCSCDLCDIYFSHVDNVQSHYNSNRHRNHLIAWKSNELKRLQPFKMYTSVLKTTKVPGKRALKTDKLSDAMLQEELRGLICIDRCYICYSSYNYPSQQKSDLYSWHSWETGAIKTIENILKNGLSCVGSDKMLRNKLVSLTCLDYCHMCYASLPHPSVAKSHYMSKKHKKKVREWRKDELKKRPTLGPKPEEQFQVREKSKNHVKNLLKKEIDEVENQDYCHICNINLSERNARLHYGGDRHKKKVRVWKSNEIKKLQPSKSDYESLDSERVGQVQEVRDTLEIAKLPDEILQEKIESLIFSDYCYLCNADLQEISDAQAHYNSNLHKNNLYAWECEEMKNRQRFKADSSIPKAVELEVQSNKIFETDKSPDEILRKRLESLILSNYCYLCNANLQEASNAQSHYNSNRHKNTFYMWISEEIKKLQAFTMDVPKVVEQVQVSETLETAKLPDEILQKKLESLILSDYCYLCNADLQEISDAQSHYNSNLHKNNLYAWECEEMKKRQRFKADSLIPKAVELEVQSNKIFETDKSPDEILRKRLESLILSNYCYLCNANLPGTSNAQSHYNSNRHKNNLYTWESEEIKKLQASTMNSSVPKVVEQVQVSETLDTDKSPEEILRKKLESLISLNYCYICNANLQDMSNAQSHYNSNRHKDQLYMWESEEMKKMETSTSSTVESSVPKVVEQIQVSETLGTDKLPDEILQKRLESLIFPNYCYICNADLQGIPNAPSHYNSNRHQNNFYRWESEEIKKLQLSKMNSSAPKAVEQVNRSKTLEMDKSPHEILPKRLESYYNYCYLCNVNLREPSNAQSHYNSNRHKTNLHMLKSEEIKKLQASTMDSSVPKVVEQVQVSETLETAVVVPVQSQSNRIETNILQPTSPVNQNLGLKYMKPLVDPLCRVCGINVGTDLEVHYKSESHKRCAETFCFVCDIKAMSKQCLIAHVNGIKHKSNLDIKNKESNMTLSQEGDLNRELMQNTKSNRQITVEEANKGTQVTSKSLPLRWCYCDICKMALDGTEKAESHYKTAIHIIKNYFYCHLCKLKFESITMINSHVRSFPHNEMAKLMSLIVSKGISSRNIFWEFYDMTVSCKLCDAYIQSQLSAVDHFECKRHIINFDEWCFAQSKNLQDPDRRWYYCDICKQPLDGTTKVELHYQGISHVRVQKTLTNTSQASTAYDATYISIPESKEKLDGVDNKQQKINEISEIDKLSIFNDSSKIPSNTENKTPQKQMKNKTSALQSQDTQVSTKETTEANSKIYSNAKNKEREEQPENMFTLIAPKRKDTRVSTKETISVANSKISSDGDNKEQHKQTENMLTLIGSKSKDTRVSTKEPISVANSKISSDGDNKEQHEQTENMLTLIAPKSKHTRVFTKEPIVANSNISFATKNKKQHAERVENITIPILKNEHATPGSSTISRTDERTKPPKIEDSDKSNSTVEKGVDAILVQEMVQAETEKLTSTLQHIPPSWALIFLQKYTKELENFSKNFETDEDTTGCEDIVEWTNAKSMLKSNKTKNECVVM